MGSRDASLSADASPSSSSSSSTSPSSRVLQQRLFRMLQRCRSMRQLLQLHGQVLANGFSQKNFILSKLLSSCVTAGELGHASLVLRCVTRPSVTVLNQMIRGYSLSTAPDESILLYRRWRRGWMVMMVGNQVAAAAGGGGEGEQLVPAQPDSFTYLFLLAACTRARLLREGEQIHARLLPSGFIGNAFVRTKLMNMYAAAGGTGEADDAMGRARMLFDDMPNRNVVAWNVMLAGYLRCGDGASALALFESMRQRDVFSWTTMIAGCARAGRSECALALFEEMQRAHVDVDQVTMVAVLSACADLGDLDLGRRIHTHCTILSGREHYCSHGCGGRRRLGGCACCRSSTRRRKWGRRSSETVSLDNSLINMYVKCGAIEEAYEIFREMPRRDTVSWNTMIMGLAMHGRAGEALHVFRQFTSRNTADADHVGERPDGVTLLAVLCACSHAGWVREGLRYFNHHITSGSGGGGGGGGSAKVRPQIEHYGCMVDMLGRAGLLAEAQELVKGMPMAPNDVVWGALLRGCIVHGDVRLAGGVVHRLMEELDQLRPDRAAGHVAVLSNMYASTAVGWGHALQLRARMMEVGMRKPAGWSRPVIQVDGASTSHVPRATACVRT